MIEVLSDGALNTVQDRGRLGQLHLGVSRCGALDDLAFDIANALLGNERDAAAIEIALFPFRVRFDAAVDFAVTGAPCPLDLDGTALPPCWMRSARAGQTLTIGPPRRGCWAYLAVAGGVALDPVFGSRSTDLKNGFGGLSGRGLIRGDRLGTLAAPFPVLPPDYEGFGAWPEDLAGVLGGPQADIVLRVIPAAEHDMFTEAARERFYGEPWTVTAEANRMGYRLAGSALELQARRELLSHGIVPGTVQVPPSGQPIIQLADANTCGGYPKIATVIEADLWRIAQAAPGERLRFERVDLDAGLAALSDRSRFMEKLAGQAKLIARRIV